MKKWFSKDKPEEEEDIIYYKVFFGCDSGHSQYERNDGICLWCGDPVFEAVFKTHRWTCRYLGVRFDILDDGFVRWLNERRK